MITQNEVLSAAVRQIGNGFQCYVDESSQASVFILPFKDAMGDNFVVRIREGDGGYVLDDAGRTSQALFVATETTGGGKSAKVVSALARSFGAFYNENEDLLELAAKRGEIVPRLLHFSKMLIASDTMLAEVGREERETVKPHRQSLGPRAAQKLRKRLAPLIKLGTVTHKYTVDGLAVPDWVVDFAYKPVFHFLGRTVDMAVVIAVDLAVQDPIVKATHAFSRAVDIKAVHQNYDIRVAFDRHGQNGASCSAANFLHEHQISGDYSAVDLSEKEDYIGLMNRITQDIGMPLSA